MRKKTTLDPRLIHKLVPPPPKGTFESSYNFFTKLSKQYGIMILHSHTCYKPFLLPYTMYLFAKTKIKVNAALFSAYDSQKGRKQYFQAIYGALKI